MGDVVGRLFREFAITLAVAILISAVISLTLTPMMCARLLRHTPRNEQSRFYRAGGRFFDAVIARYGKMLDWVLDRQAATLLVAVGTLALTVLLYLLVPKGFFPVQDTGVIQGISEAPQSISFAAMARAPARSGRSCSARSRSGEPVIVHRRGRHQRDAQQRPHADQPEAADGARHDAHRRHPPAADRSSHRSTGITLYMQPVQDLTIEDRVSRTQYQFSWKTRMPTTWASGCRNLSSACAQSPQLADVASDLQDRACRPTSRSTAIPRAGSASRRPRSTTRSTTPLASA